MHERDTQHAVTQIPDERQEALLRANQAQFESERARIRGQFDLFNPRFAIEMGQVAAASHTREQRILLGEPAELFAIEQALAPAAEVAIFPAEDLTHQSDFE